MELITPPPQFSHAGQLPEGQLSHDPRESRVNDFAIDLRACEFVRPPAVLWCAIYCLLAARQATSCEVLVPEHMGVASYLKATGLFDLLTEHGVSVDDDGIEPVTPGLMVLPLRRLDMLDDAWRLGNEIGASLSHDDLGAANLRPLVVETFGELIQNAVEHSESPIGSYGMIQYYDWQAGPRFVCVAADGGIGIRRSLMKNPALQPQVSNDWDAIELAMREGNSGTGQSIRGVGLSTVADDMASLGRGLLIHSGSGIVSARDLQMRARQGSFFPGTLAAASLRT